MASYFPNEWRARCTANIGRLTFAATLFLRPAWDSSNLNPNPFMKDRPKRSESKGLHLARIANQRIAEFSFRFPGHPAEQPII